MKLTKPTSFSGLISIILFVGSLALAISAGWTFSSGFTSNPQGERNKVIKKKKNSVGPDEPVEITVVKTHKGVVELDREFDDDDEWVRGLRLTVKNVTDKNITYVNVQLFFERPKDDNNPPLLHSISYGNKTAASSASQVLSPGRSVDLTLSSSSYDAIKRALNKLGYSVGANRVDIALSEVVFDDDTMWSHGYWFRRDPTDRQNWIPFQFDAPSRSPPKNALSKRQAALAPISFVNYEDSKASRPLRPVQSGQVRTSWCFIFPNVCRCKQSVLYEGIYASVSGGSSICDS